MPWARVDDGLHSHPKIRRAWKCRPALGLHLMALSYCGQWSPDGLVPVEWVEEKLPAEEERETVVGALVDAGLWDVDPSGWAIHDWADYNQPEQARARSERARAAAAARWANARGNASGNASGNAQSDSEQSQNHAPRAPARGPGKGKGLRSGGSGGRTILGDAALAAEIGRPEADVVLAAAQVRAHGGTVTAGSVGDYMRSRPDLFDDEGPVE